MEVHESRRVVEWQLVSNVNQIRIRLGHRFIIRGICAPEISFFVRAALVHHIQVDYTA
jgi:hypothetical protein